MRPYLLLMVWCLFTTPPVRAADEMVDARNRIDALGARLDQAFEQHLSMEALDEDESFEQLMGEDGEVYLRYLQQLTCNSPTQAYALLHSWSQRLERWLERSAEDPEMEEMAEILLAAKAAGLEPSLALLHASWLGSGCPQQAMRVLDLAQVPGKSAFPGDPKLTAARFDLARLGRPSSRIERARTNPVPDRPAGKNEKA